MSGGTGEATVLAMIVSIDPIYVYVDADECSVLKYRRLAREGKRVSARDTQIPLNRDNVYCTYFAANFYISAAKDNIRFLT